MHKILQIAPRLKSIGKYQSAPEITAVFNGILYWLHVSGVMCPSIIKMDKHEHKGSIRVYAHSGVLLEAWQPFFKQ